MGSRKASVVLAGALTALLFVSGAGQTADGDILRIGSSGATTDKTARDKENAALGTLRGFIKEETGMDNELFRMKDWRDLADKMEKGKLQLGVFEGYEFAWAKEKHPRLKPLAIAVNVDRYPVACVVVNRDSRAKDFVGLQGKSVYLPPAGPHHLRVFAERQSQINGKDLTAFFSRITSAGGVEDALDDVVDGMVEAAAVDRAALEAYKRRKPGRYNRLKEVARSQPFPSPVVAYYGEVPDEASRRRFLAGLLASERKERGKMMLTIFRVSGFQAVPADFEKVLARTQKDYPQRVDKTK